MMKANSFHLKVLWITVFVLIIFAFLFSKNKIEIFLEPNSKLLDYKLTYINVQNLDERLAHDKRFGPDASFVEDELRIQLRRFGFDIDSYDGQKPQGMDLILNCSFDSDWGPPKIIRHYRFLIRYRKHINLEFLDAISRKPVARVSYTRGFLAYDDNDIKVIFATLEQKLKEAGGWKVKRKD